MGWDKFIFWEMVRQCASVQILDNSSLWKNVQCRWMKQCSDSSYGIMYQVSIALMLFSPVHLFTNILVFYIINVLMQLRSGWGGVGGRSSCRVNTFTIFKM